MHLALLLVHPALKEKRLKYLWSVSLLTWFVSTLRINLIHMIYGPPSCTPSTNAKKAQRQFWHFQKMLGARSIHRNWTVSTRRGPAGWCQKRWPDPGWVCKLLFPWKRIVSVSLTSSVFSVLISRERSSVLSSQTHTTPLHCCSCKFAAPRRPLTVALDPNHLLSEVTITWILTVPVLISHPCRRRRLRWGCWNSIQRRPFLNGEVMYCLFEVCELFNFK